VRFLKSKRRFRRKGSKIFAGVNDGSTQTSPAALSPLGRTRQPLRRSSPRQGKRPARCRRRVNWHSLTRNWVHGSLKDNMSSSRTLGRVLYGYEYGYERTLSFKKIPRRSRARAFDRDSISTGPISPLQILPEAAPRLVLGTITSRAVRTIYASSYNHPFVLAIRAASTRFPAPSLLIASER
jgi:hypothetical protein